MKTRSQAQQRHLSSSPFPVRPAPPVERFTVDDRVTHDTYGLGRIVGEEAAAVTVDFGSYRVRIVSPFAKLTKL